jgi:hypothetical protein
VKGQIVIAGRHACLSLTTTEKRSDEVLDKLILDIKAFVLLEGSEGALQNSVRERVLESHDEQVRQFVGAVQSGRKRGNAQLVVIGLGELVLASILILVGTVALVPNVVGMNTPQELLSYFSTQILAPLANSPLSQYASAIEFLIGAFLLFAAFHTLRQAALSFKGMGLSVDTSDD